MWGIEEMTGVPGYCLDSIRNNIRLGRSIAGL